MRYKIRKMDEHITIIRQNIDRLLRMREIQSRRQLAAMANVDPKTVNSLLTDAGTPKTNISITKLSKIARALGVEIWMLLIRDFPFDTAANRNIKKITPSGYQLLYSFERASSDMIRYAMLDSIAHSLSRVDDQAAGQIKEAQIRYFTK